MGIGKLLDRIQEQVSARANLSRLVNVSLKTYAGLLRYRLVRPDFMTPDDATLYDRQTRIFGALLKRANQTNRHTVVKLTQSLIEWCEKRGTDRTILQWDDNEGESES